MFKHSCDQFQIQLINSNKMHHNLLLQHCALPFFLSHTHCDCILISKYSNFTNTANNWYDSLPELMSSNTQHPNSAKISHLHGNYMD